MKTYTATFPAHWLGGQAVVVAQDKGHAKRLLAKVCGDEGILLKASEIELYELDTTQPRAVITNNGDY